MSPHTAFNILYNTDSHGQDYQYLYELSDHQLKDIGICRGEIHRLKVRSIRNGIKRRMRALTSAIAQIF